MLGRAFPLLVTVAIACFGAAPFLIGAAPYESTMGLVQKIFYFHAPSGMTMFVGACVAGCGERRVSVHRQNVGRSDRRRGRRS